MTKPSKSTGLSQVFRRELVRIFTTRTPSYLMIVLPLVSFWLLWTIFQAGSPSHLPVAVCDQDNSVLSRQLIRMIDATRTMQVAFRVSDVGEGDQLMREGKIYTLVLLPRDLERDIKRAQAPSVVAYYNAQWILPGSLISRDLRTVVATASAGIDLSLRMKGGEGNPGARSHLEPILLESHPLFNPRLDYLNYLLSALLPTMLQIFITILTVHAFGRELKDRTAAQWLDTAGGSIVRAVAGKLLPYTIGFTVLSLFMITLLYRYLGVPVRGNLSSLFLGTVLFVLSYQGMGLLFIAWTRNLRFATSVAAFYTTPAFAFVGITFPLLAMPAFGRFWGALLPLTHYLKLMVEQGTRGAPLTASVPEILILLIFVIVAPLLSLGKMSQAARDPVCWGRL